MEISGKRRNFTRSRKPLVRQPLTKAPEAQSEVFAGGKYQFFSPKRAFLGRIAPARRGPRGFPSFAKKSGKRACNGPQTPFRSAPMKTNSLPRIGSIVRFPLQRGGFATGTIAKIDRKSAFARAYGADVTFSDSPYSARLSQCEKIGQVSRTVSTVNPCAKIRAEYDGILAKLHREAKRDRCAGDIVTGWDWPTLAIVKPLEYKRLRELNEQYKTEFRALRAAGLLPSQQ